MAFSMTVQIAGSIYCVILDQKYSYISSYIFLLQTSIKQIWHDIIIIILSSDAKQDLQQHQCSHDILKCLRQ